MKKVVYTVLIGNYDELKDPSFINEEWDYICFSDHLKQDDYNVWKIENVNHDSLSTIELSRLPKLCPHLFLKDYDISLYIDSNIDLKSNFIYQRAKELEQDLHAIISIPKHPTRDCIYEEAEILKYRGKTIPHLVNKQLSFLLNQGFPKNYGLFENNIIWRRHQNDQITQLGNDWWELLLKYSKRDQMGFSYCLWKHQINCLTFMPPEISDHRKCQHFEFNKHNTDIYLPLKRFWSKFIYILKNRKAPY